MISMYCCVDLHINAEDMKEAKLVYPGRSLTMLSSQLVYCINSDEEGAAPPSYLLTHPCLQAWWDSLRAYIKLQLGLSERC